MLFLLLRHCTILGGDGGGVHGVQGGPAGAGGPGKVRLLHAHPLNPQDWSPTASHLKEQKDHCFEIICLYFL